MLKYDAHIDDIPMFNVKYLAMHKMKMHDGVISNTSMFVRTFHENCDKLWFILAFRRTNHTKTFTYTET